MDRKEIMDARNNIKNLSANLGPVQAHPGARCTPGPGAGAPRGPVQAHPGDGSEGVGGVLHGRVVGSDCCMGGLSRGCGLLAAAGSLGGQSPGDAVIVEALARGCTGFYFWAILTLELGDGR